MSPLRSIHLASTPTLQKRIQIATRERDALNQEIASLQAECNHRLNQDSPIAKLPVDVLVYIFKIAQSQVSQSTTPFEIIATRVSSSWRCTVVEAPFLWSRIILQHKGIASKEVLWWKGPRVLDLYITRSQSCLLTISFDFPKWEQYLNQLVPFVKRWKRLSLVHYGEATPGHTFRTLTHLTAPALEYLNFNSNHPPSSLSWTSWRGVSNFSAPSLKTVSISFAIYRVCHPALHTVTTLLLGAIASMTSIGESDLRSILLSAPNVINISLKFTQVIPGGESQLPLVPIPLHRLKRLRLRVAPSFVWMATHTAMPQMDTLEFQDMEHLYTPRDRSLQFGNVKSLTFVNCTTEDPIPLNVATTFPLIENLTIDEEGRFEHNSDLDYDSDEDSYDSDVCLSGDCEWEARFRKCRECEYLLEERNERRRSRDEADDEPAVKKPVFSFSLGRPLGGGTSSIPWPELTTLTIRDMDCFGENAEEDTLLKDLALRSEVGHPVETVVVPIGSARYEYECLQGLSSLGVKVEESDEYYDWE